MKGLQAHCSTSILKLLNMAIEIVSSPMENIVVAHSCVNVYQRVNPINSPQTTIFLWFSHDFPIQTGAMVMKHHLPSRLKAFKSLTSTFGAHRGD